MNDFEDFYPLPDPDDPVHGVMLVVVLLMVFVSICYWSFS